MICKEKKMKKIRQSIKLPAEQRRNQLLESAHRLFSERGYRETSTEEIAHHAGLTKGALYFHFKSKEDILFALIQKVADTFHKTMGLKAKGLHEPGDILREILNGCKLSRPREFRSVMDIWVQAMQVPRIRKYLNKVHHESTAQFCKMIGNRPGWTKRELEQLGIMIHTLADGLAAHRVLNYKAIDIEMQVKLFQSMFEGRELKAKSLKRKNQLISSDK
jgi:AcrR family transcriptional regulator